MNENKKTEYVLSLSYGKDSLACLEAIKILGYPLDRIITAEVWATDTIPADLPPMMEFKEKADKIIKERYGITVEHTYATTKRERENGLVTRNSSTPLDRENAEGLRYMDSPAKEGHGVIHDSKYQHSNQSEKVTFETVFYHIPKRKPSAKAYEGMITGFPNRVIPWCNSQLKTRALRQLAFH